MFFFSTLCFHLIETMTSLGYEASRKSGKLGWNTRHENYWSLKNMLVIQEIRGKSGLCLIVALWLLLITEEYAIAILLLMLVSKTRNGNSQETNKMLPGMMFLELAKHTHPTCSILSPLIKSCYTIFFRLYLCKGSSDTENFLTNQNTFSAPSIGSF